MKYSNTTILEGIMKELKEIGKLTLPMCKHRDNKINQVSAKINEKAHNCYKILDHHREQLLEVDKN